MAVSGAAASEHAVSEGARDEGQTGKSVAADDNELMNPLGTDAEDVKKDGSQALSVQIPGATEDIAGDALVTGIDVTSHAGDVTK